jgi:hypothetical protein
MNTKEHGSDGNASNIDQITTILNGPALEKAWKECLSAWEDSSPAQRADCRAFAVNLRDTFVRILRDVDDPQEQETIASIFYTQVKSQWILINTQSGYQIQKGRVEGALFCRAGMLSALLGALEPVLRKSDLTRITNFLAEPEAQIGGNSFDGAALSALLGTDVVFAPVDEEDVLSTRIIVDARTIENRFREMAAQIEDSERQWKELQADLNVNNRSEIVPLFEKFHSRALPSDEHNPDVVLSRAAQSEWAERRELQLRTFRKEIAALQADWEQVRIETGATDTAALITAWRNTRDTLRTVRAELAKERAELSALRAEYGDTASAQEILLRLRKLSTELAEAQASREKLRADTDYLVREFGTFNASRIVELVRGLRGQVGGTGKGIRSRPVRQ